MASKNWYSSFRTGPIQQKRPFAILPTMKVLDATLLVVLVAAMVGDASGRTTDLAELGLSPEAIAAEARGEEAPVHFFPFAAQHTNSGNTSSCETESRHSCRSPPDVSMLSYARKQQACTAGRCLPRKRTPLTLFSRWSPPSLLAAAAMQGWIVDYRRKLHASPELMFELASTAAIIRAGNPSTFTPHG